MDDGNCHTAHRPSGLLSVALALPTRVTMRRILLLSLLGVARAHIPWLDAPDLIACATARLRFGGPDGSGPSFLVTVRTLSDGVDPSAAPVLFSFPPAIETLDWPVALPAGTRVSFQVCNAAGEFAGRCSFGSVRTVRSGADSTCLGADGRGLASASASAAVRLSSSISALEGVASATPTACVRPAQWLRSRLQRAERVVGHLRDHSISLLSSVCCCRLQVRCRA